jgi:hypothetical protein
MLDPQFANRSKFANWPIQFANGQSSRIGRNIYVVVVVVVVVYKDNLLANLIDRHPTRI